MAQLTTTRFDPTAAQTRRATVRGARVPAKVRVVQATERRVESQIAAAQSQPTQAQAAAGGRVRRPGGEALIPLRGDYRTAGTPVGAAVSYADGQVSARPLVGGGVLQGPTVRALVIGDREPLPTDARWDSDLWLDATTQALYVWRRDLSEEDGGLWLPTDGVSERAIGIASPVANNVYGIIPRAEADYIPLTFVVNNRTATGGTATAGTGTLLVNGVAATLGVTAIAPGDFVGVRVDTVGVGVFYATLTVRGG